MGFARLSLRCGAPAEGAPCRGAFETALRAPAEAGGGTVSHRSELWVTREGRAVRVVDRSGADGAWREREDGPGPVPASFAELLLASAAEGERRCLAVRDELSGEDGEACALRRGAWLEGSVLGEPIRFCARQGEAPAEVVLPAQGARFVRDDGAALPAAAPRLYGTRARADEDGRVCGHLPDRPLAADPPPELPRSFPAGASCRERTARWLALARAAGLEGRHAVGLAEGGDGLVWHEWAEIRTPAGWLAVDPSFEQVPARGPRFTIGRWSDESPESRARAGRAVLDCWSHAR